MHRVDGAPIEQLRKRTSEKWTAFLPDVLPLPVAEMDFEIAQPIKDAIIQMVQTSDTGYMGTSHELANNFATFARKRWNWEVDPEEVYLCTDVGVGMIEMSRRVVQPGDKILVNQPVYYNLRSTWIPELHCQVVDAPLRKEGMHYTLDLEAIEAGYKSGVKMHYLCNPHNPTGTVYSRDELAKIAELAKQYNVIVASDEIHAPLTFAESTFVPFLSVSETAREVGFTVTSASKTWNLAGFKCAHIVTAHPAMKALADSMPPAVKFRASLFGAKAGAIAWTCEEWLDDALLTLDRNRKAIALQLAAKAPSVGYRIPNCSYLGWLDLSSLNLGENAAASLLENQKLAVTSGTAFGPGLEQYVRLNFGTSLEILTDALDRIAAAAR